MYTIASIPKGVVAVRQPRDRRRRRFGRRDRVPHRLPEEVDAARGEISLSSPIGRAMMNKAEGDEVEVQTPSGKRTYQILALVTWHEQEHQPAS
jgi:hypothetical protein